MSKSHPEQWMICEVAERPEKSLVNALREFATTQIADCGGPVAVMAPPLRHMAGGAQLCGPAVTVWTKPGDILYVLKAADLIAAGDVLVVDGAVRDLDGLDEAGLPTFALAAHPAATGIDDLISKLAPARPTRPGSPSPTGAPASPSGT